MKLTRFRKVYLLLLLVFHLFIFAGLYFEGLQPLSQNKNLPPKIIEIQRGEGLIDIAQKLYQNGIIKNRVVFIIEALRSGKNKEFKAGEYAFYPYQTISEILDILSKGKVFQHKITVFEGATLWQIAEILEKEGVCSKKEFLKWAENKEFLRELGVPSDTAEGFLYPDTYFFAKNTPCPQFISTMVRNFWEKWKSIEPLAQKSNLTLREIVILASIVEKEAFYDSEKPIIAAVYLNRLKKGMPLQADPTINYALKSFRRLTYKDYRSVKSPYNTYLHNDLPPTPIGNPSLSSLKAVLTPAKVPYLYFVADGTGKHIFSKTYKEHLKAINEVRKAPPTEELEALNEEFIDKNSQRDKFSVLR